MFIPLHDANSLKRIKLQWVTLGLIAANVLIFLATSGVTDQQGAALAYGLGYVPAVVNDWSELPRQLVLVPEDFTYVTYAFLHGGWLHLGGNMIFLWVFGDNVEDALGHFRFLLFYLLCAAAGAFLHGAVAPQSPVPLVGASGAIAGIVTAYLMLHPRVKIWILAFARIPLRIPAWIALALWIGMQFLMFLAGSDDEVSWACHVGGILAGAVLVLVLRQRGVPLFDSEIVTPAAVVPRQESAVGMSQQAPAPRWGRQ